MVENGGEKHNFWASDRAKASAYPYVLRTRTRGGAAARTRVRDESADARGASPLQKKCLNDEMVVSLKCRVSC